MLLDVSQRSILVLGLLVYLFGVQARSRPRLYARSNFVPVCSVLSSDLGENRGKQGLEFKFCCQLACLCALVVCIQSTIPCKLRSRFIYDLLCPCKTSSSTVQRVFSLVFLSAAFTVCGGFASELFPLSTQVIHNRSRLDSILVRFALISWFRSCFTVLSWLVTSWARYDEQNFRVQS